MTIAEQIAEWAVTHGPAFASALGALGFAIRGWVNSRAARNLSAARVEDAAAGMMEDLRARDKARDAEMARMREDLAECHAAREEQRETIGSLELGCAELRRIIDEMREQLRGWQRSLEKAGIPAEDSDERDAALAELTGDAGAHRAEKARIRRLREASGHRGGGTDS